MVIANKISCVEVETLIRFQKDLTINMKTLGAFTYFSGKGLINQAESIGRACMIKRNVSIGLANQSVNSVSSCFIFGESNCEWLDPFYSLTVEERKATHKKVWDSELIKKRTVRIENDIWIGAGVQILLSVTIGDGAIIGAGSIVTKDVPPYCVVSGNPARIIRKRFPDEIIERLCNIKWWEYGIDIMNMLIKTTR